MASGEPRSVAMKLTGHRTESIYRRYAIVCESDLSDAVARVAKLLGTLPPWREKRFVTVERAGWATWRTMSPRGGRTGAGAFARKWDGRFPWPTPPTRSIDQRVVAEGNAKTRGVPEPALGAEAGDPECVGAVGAPSA